MLDLITPDDPQFVLAPDALFAPELIAPPAEWFTEFPEWFDQVPMNKVWVDSDGRVAGRTFGPTCLLDGNESECWIPVASPTGYEAFHQGVQPFITRSGAAVSVSVEAVGVIGGNVGHAPENLSFDAAHKWYASTGDQLMIGRAHDQRESDGVHGYFLGAILPNLTVDDVAKIRRSALSCDWRYRLTDNAGRPLNAYDNLGPWLVTRPGLPLDRRGIERVPRMRYRALAASVGAPPAYVLEPIEEITMTTTGCKKDCACQAPAHQAAAQPAPAQDPEMAPAADLASEVAELRHTVETMAGAFAELAATVAEIMMSGVELADIDGD